MLTVSTLPQVPVVGVIYNPLLDEMYTAWRGGGAFLNDKPITVASAKVQKVQLIMV